MLELLLGFSMLLVVMLSVFQLFPMANASVDLADRTTHANALARELMEKYLNLQYSSLEAGESGQRRIGSHTSRHGASISTEYNYDVTVQLLDPSRDIKEITVVVSWSTSGKAKRVILQSRRGNQW